MIAWLTLNCSISVITLLVVRLLKNAPAQFGFFAACGALACWCLPLQPVVVTEAPQMVSDYDIVPIGPALLESTVPVQAISEVDFWAIALLSSAFIGLLVLCFRGWQSMILVRRLHMQSRPVTDEDLPPPFAVSASRIRVVTGRTAMTSGLFRPTVWIGEELLARPEVESVLAHELTHARRLDNTWVLAIEMVRHALWWNPLVWILANLARTRLEMSCDEASATKLATGHYLRQVTQLAQFLPTQNAFGASAIAGRKAIVGRIEHLASDPRLTARHLAVIGSALALLISVVLQAEERQPSPLGKSASTSLSIADDGTYELNLDNAHYGAAIQMLASLGRLHVLAHPEINHHRITVTIVGTTENWMDGVNALLNANPDFSDRFGVAREGENLLLAAKELLEPDNRTWLGVALIMGHMKPAPDDLSLPRVSADLLVRIDDIEMQRPDLLLVNKNWFGVRQAGFEVNVKPTILEGDQILIEFRISEIDSGKLVATPSLLTLSEKDAIVEIGTDETIIRVEVTPRLLTSA